MGECRRSDGIRKYIYLRYRLAFRAARRLERKHGWAMRAYQCSVCEHYHLARLLHEGLPVLILEHLRGGEDI